MRAKSEYPTTHGDQNAIDGSDPVPPGVWFTPVLTNGSGFIRFRRTNENDVQFEADLTDLNPGDVVTTVDAPYRPAQDAYGVGKYGADDSTPGVCVWKLQTNGDLVFVGTASGSGTDTTAIHWGPNTDPTGAGVTISDVSAAPLFDLSTPGLAVIYTRIGWAFIVQNEAGDSVLYADDAGNVNCTLGVGQEFIVYDNTGGRMLQMTEGSPDLHLPTGGNVIFDL